MKKSIISIMIMMLLLCSWEVSFAEKVGYGQECPALLGINWGDSLETVQKWIGHGEVQKMGDNWSVLIYKDQEIANYDATYGLYFMFDHMYQVHISVFDLGNDELGKIFLDAYSQMYGDYILTDHHNASTKQFEQVDDGDVYWWRIDEYSGVYMQLFPGNLTIDYILHD